MNRRKLFEQFPPVTTREWMDKINADLKGADFNKRLVWKTNEGFDVMPLYRREYPERTRYLSDPLSSILRHDLLQTNRKNNSWLIRQDIKVTDYAGANRKARTILQKGIDSAGFIISDPETINEKNFKMLLEGIDPECTEINFFSNGKAREIISILAKVFLKNRNDLLKIRGAVETDPLGRLMMNGTLCIPVEAGFEYLASLSKEASVLPFYRNLQVNGSNFTNSGANSVQELGFTMAMAVEYLSRLSELGIVPEITASKIRFSFGVGSNYFMEIAKLRAARILWSVIGRGYNSDKINSWRMEIHSSTSRWNTTVYDPYINMLRTQTEAMSAVLGGTDSLTVLPFDTAFREPSEFSERIARNQQLILKEEAFFDKVADPAAGSYYIENLTALVAENSWKLFLEVEEMGGFLSALKSGFIQKKISESAEKRRLDIAKRKEILVGTNQYPDNNEKIADDANPVFRSRVMANFEPDVEPVSFQRGAECIEKIRFAADIAAKRPAVFLLKIGNEVMRKARAHFSSAFFGCAGYRVIDGEPFDNIDTAVKAALDASADIVVICSSDEEYPVVAPGIFCKIEGKALVVIAGNPECIDYLKSQGLENYIHIRSDLSETLKLFNTKVGLDSLLPV